MKDNLLATYLREINRVPLLSREDEEKYAALASNGDKAAKEILIKSNLRFVVNVAKKFRNRGIPMSDLISEGNIGLINAIDKYDAGRGYHFISYAVWWIRQAILKAIGEKSRMIRLPLNRFGELVHIEKARKTLYEKLGREPEVKEIAAVVSLEESLIRDLLDISREYVSLDAPVMNGDRDNAVVSDFVEDKNHQLPEDVLVDSSLKEEIAKLLAMLPEKEADILKQRYGLCGFEPKSLKEIGEIYSLTKERIRQIEKKAIARLKSFSQTKHIQVYSA